MARQEVEKAKFLKQSCSMGGDKGKKKEQMNAKNKELW
jgi:hypothetical protein